MLDSKPALPYFVFINLTLSGEDVVSILSTQSYLPTSPLACSWVRPMLRTGDEVELPDIKWKQPADPDVGGQWGLPTHGSGRRFSYILATTQGI